MFGNRNGWILSAIILLLTGGLLWALYKRGTEPVGIGPVGMMAPRLTLTPPVPPRALATWMTEDADATDLYRQALDHVKDNEFAYKDFKGIASSPEYERIRKGLDLLVQARTRKKAAVFGSTPELLITNDLTLPPLRDQVKPLRTAALKYAMGLLAEKKPDEARRVLHAMFSLGVHLTEEKIIYEEWREGNELLAVSHYLKTQALAESEEQRKQMEDFDQKFKTFRIDVVAPLHLFVLKYDPDPARNDPVRLPGGQVAGFETWTADMIELARNSAEPTWRVEATMACGRGRFQGLTNVDQRAAAAALRDLSGDANPHVRRAAQLGLALTKTDVERMQPHLVP